jgi:predicted PurR-regulated permease PerM
LLSYGAKLFQAMLFLFIVALALFIYCSFVVVFVRNHLLLHERRLAAGFHLAFATVVFGAWLYSYLSEEEAFVACGDATVCLKRVQVQR